MSKVIKIDMHKRYISWIYLQAHLSECVGFNVPLDT